MKLYSRITEELFINDDDCLEFLRHAEEFSARLIKQFYQAKLDNEPRLLDKFKNRLL